MIAALITFLCLGALVLVVTHINLKQKDGELTRLAYWDQYWGFYDTAGDPEKALASVEPGLKNAALDIIERVGTVRGTWQLRAFEGRRTLVRQRKLYYKGTGTRLPYKHAFGYAIDLVPWDSVKKKWNFSAMVYFDNAIKKALAAHLDITWGGYWSKRDMYHFELSWGPPEYASIKAKLTEEGLA